MSIHQTIFETLRLSDEEVFAIVGGGDISSVQIRREKMRAFLADHAWSEDAYKDWLRSGHGKSWDVSQPSRGLGDTVAKLTSAVGIVPCGGCKQRQAKLNKMIPYKGKR